MTDLNFYMNRLMKKVTEGVREINIELQIHKVKNEFLRQNYHIFNQKGKLGTKDTASYLKDLNFSLKFILVWSVNSRKSMAMLQEYMSSLVSRMSNKIEEFRAFERETYDKLATFKPEISLIIQVQSLLFLIQSQNRIIGLHD